MALPTEFGGRTQVVPNGLPDGVYGYFAGSGDHPTSGVGEGPLFALESVDVGDRKLTIAFNDSVWIAGGTVLYWGATLGDWASLELVAPASTANGTPGVGNAEIASGVLVPAINGGVTVDLATAVPVPANGQGFWDWTAPMTGRGVVTPSATPGQAAWHLVPAPVPIARFAKVPLLADGSFALSLPNMYPARIPPQWEVVTTLHNGTQKALRFSWVLTLARAVTR